MDNTPVTIQLGESLESFQARYSNRARITYQPAGVNFVKINWPAEARGLVHFEHGIHSFDIPHVRGASSGEDEGELKNEGLNWFLINAGTGFDGPTPHIEAQKAFYALLKRIQDAGWQRYIPLGLRKLSHLNSELSFCNDKEKQILLSFPNRREDFSESFAVLRLGFVGLGYCKTDRGQLALDKYHLHQAA